MASPAERDFRPGLPPLRIGTGLDVHAFAPDRKLMLGGVEIDHPLGLAGHSDADVLVHAILDALLGAMGLRDIGYYYPPDQERWRAYSGRAFLQDMRQRLADEGWAIVNLDCVVVAQRPKLSPHIPRMIEAVAAGLGIAPTQVGIKATTTESLGFTGRGEGILAQAVVLLQRAPR